MEQPSTVQPEAGDAGAAGRSYVNASLIALLLYFLCYFPGLILNIYWLVQSTKVRRVTGRAPEGQGCLIALLTAAVVVPVILLPCFVILAAIAVPNFLEAQTRAGASRVRADLRILATAIESYHIDNNEFPAATTLPEMTHDFDRLDETARQQEQIPTFARRNWHTDEDPGVKSLTTPVAYLTRMFPDPFASPAGMGFRYWTDGGGWIVWSSGPDKEYAITDPSEVYSSDEPQPSDALLHRSWDPTNGTISPGDIWRVRQ